MKTKFSLFLLFFFFQNSFGQRLHLKILSNNETEKKIIDSTNYKKTHENAKSIQNEINSVSNNLLKKGYLSIKTEAPTKSNDTLFVSKFKLGDKTDFIHIYIGVNSELLNLEKDTIKIKLQNTETFLNQSLLTLEKKGYSLTRIQLINFKNQNKKLYCDLYINTEKNRKLDEIIINENSKFPTSHLIQLKKQYRKKTFNQEILKSLNTDLEKFRFVKQSKPPEILFTQDSTKVYVYFEKTKPNSFDGFIGFNNNENKFKLNGYADIKLHNILNSGEKFNIYWKSDGNKQKTFNAIVELPYIFKSSFGLKGQLNIFKQDSTFQNARTSIDLGYYIKYNSKIYIGYQSIESSDIQNTNSSTISDYKSNFITPQFEYSNSSIDDFLFPEKTSISIKTGFGSRDGNLKKEKQFFFNINISHNIYLNKKNIINLKSQNTYLSSNNYIINELPRFGGINSIRGFNENSLQGNLFTSILTEYRYLFNNSFYIHSIIDYGYFEDKTTAISNNLKSIGIGSGIYTKNGLLNIVYANGKIGNNKKSESLFHVSLKLNF